MSYHIKTWQLTAKVDQLFTYRIQNSITLVLNVTIMFEKQESL